MKIKRSMKVIFSAVVLSLLVTGCSKGDNLDTKIYHDAIIEKMKEEGEGVDELEILSVKDSDLNDIDEEFLNNKYSPGLPYKKSKLKIKFSNMTMDASGNVVVMLIKPEATWKVGYMEREDITEWVFEPKVNASTHEVLNGLKEHEFDGFEKGYIGNEEVTFVSIDSRENDGTKETLDMIIEVETEFADYKFEATGEYVFVAGSWTQTNLGVQDRKDWDITYKSNAKSPQIKNKDDVLKLVSDKKNLISYLYNKDYISKSDVKEPVELANSTQIIYQYLVDLTYDDLGTFSYQVNVPYKWVGDGWKEETVVSEYDSLNIEEMKGKWKSENYEMVITSVDEDGYISGHFTKDGDDKNFKLLLEVPIREDGWELKLENFPKNIFGELEKGTVSLKDKTIGFNKEIFKKVK